MKRTVLLTFSKPTQTDCLLWLLLGFPFLFGFLNDLLGLPWAIRYAADWAWCILVLFLVRFRRAVDLRPVNRLLIWVLLFFIFTLLGYSAQYQSVLYYLWGFRNLFRFYACFFACAAFLTEENAARYLNWMDRLFWLNATVSLFQYFLLGLEGDYLGGIFGREKGVNSYTNLFFLIVTAKSLLCCLSGQESPLLCLGKWVTAAVIAAMAEVKFFYVELVLVLVLALSFTRSGRKRIWVTLGGALALMLGIALTVYIFPNLTGWFTPERIFESAASDAGYTSSGDLNRLNGIRIINETWLKTGIQRLFGLGLGNCDTASYPFLSTPFYLANGDTHYTWMSYAILYLETGYVGLSFYFGFFLGCYRLAARAERRPGANPLFCRLAKIMALCCIPIAVYNASLRGEAAYMAYFVLSLPYLSKSGSST